MAIRAVLPPEWSRLRSLRLQALAEAPTAFGSTLAQEAAFPDSVWQERAAAGATSESRITFIIEQDDGWLGSATALRTNDTGAVTVTLVGLWVNPAVRGQRLGEQLVAAVTAWAERRGATVLDLWVTITNAPAIALYERCGFRPSEERQPLPHTPSLLEMRMWRPMSGVETQ